MRKQHNADKNKYSKVVEVYIWDVKVSNVMKIKEIIGVMAKKLGKFSAINKKVKVV